MSATVSPDPGCRVAPGALRSRAAELARIDAALQAAAAGSGGLLAVLGVTGIGKTALLRAAADRAGPAGLRVLRARATEHESGTPFGVARQWLEPVLRAADPGERARLLDGAAGLGWAALADDGGPGDAPPGVLHGLHWLVANLAERGPVLALVDDAQWADDSSLRLLRFLLPRLDALRVALVLGVRREGDDVLPSTLAELLTDAACERLTPAPLSAGAVADLLADGTADAVHPAFAAACHAATGGNPFLLTELARTLREEGVAPTAEAAGGVPALAPAAVTDRVRIRLARVGPGTRALAGALAILGDGAPLGHAATLAGLEEEAADDAVDELRSAGVLGPAPGLAFEHPLLRSAVLAGVPAAQRRSGHRAAADLLRRLRAAPERVAPHLLALPSAGRADDLRTLRDAAQAAVARGAPGAAVALLERALAESPDAATRSRVLGELGRAERIAGRPAEARRHLLEAVAADEDPTSRAATVAELGAVLPPDPRELTALVPTLDAAAEHPGEADAETVLRIDTGRLLVATFGAREPDGRAQEIARRFARLPGDTPAESAALVLLAEHRRGGGADAEEVGGLAERAVRHADELLEAGAETPWSYVLLETLRDAERLGTAAEVADRGVRIARRLGAPRSFAAAAAHRSLVHRDAGRLREAEADARAAADVPAEDPVWRAMPPAILAACLLDRGDVDGAAQAFAAAGLPEHVPPLPSFALVLRVRMRVRAAQGRTAEALADHSAALGIGTAAASPGAHVADHLVAVALLRESGDDAAADRLLAWTADAARRWGTAGALARVERATARDVAGLHRAAARAAASPARLEHARALADLGRALLATGRRADAREALLRGHALARDCGADGLAWETRRALAACGVEVPRAGRSGPAALTPAELRIAEHAATGASNAAIAQALFVTVKTVEMHLTNVYRKLGVAGRGGLADALRRP